jgi:uncharacterized repeat protein (TIGR03803 family)
MQRSGWISKVVARAAKAAPMFILAIVSGTTQLAPAQTYKTVYRFTGGRDGAEPLAPVILDDAGNLYGTTTLGGDLKCNRPHGCGTVFKIDAAGKETVLHAFTSMPDGAYPQAGLIRDDSGNFYGTTGWGGAYGSGTVFKLDATGKETVLYSFTGGRDGALPFGSLVRDGKGNLYGTTYGGGGILSCYYIGGVSTCGVVFKLANTGRLTVLHRFDGSDGSWPTKGLARDSEGNLYGTTSAGNHNYGIVFKVDNTRKFSVLHTFEDQYSDGSEPGSTLILDQAGNLYGTTRLGGTVFKIDATGKETILYRFPGLRDGMWPSGNLVRDAAGIIYGTTEYGGHCQRRIGCGTIYRLDTNGQETLLHEFGRGPGRVPKGGLVMDSAGTLYGTTWEQK